MCRMEDASRPEGLVPCATVRLLVSGFGEGCRRFGGLGVRCRLSPFPFPLFWSSCWNEQLARRKHEPF